MASVGDLVVNVTPKMSEEFTELLAAASGVEGDVIEKVNAGAALVFALLYSRPDVVLGLPEPAAHAFLRAQRAYGVD